MTGAVDGVPLHTQTLIDSSHDLYPSAPQASCAAFSVSPPHMYLPRFTEPGVVTIPQVAAAVAKPGAMIKQRAIALNTFFITFLLE